MEITTNKCNGCIYYDYMYLICTKPPLAICQKEEQPNGVICPGKSDCTPYTTKINTYTSSMITRKCIICGKTTSNAEEMICDECKEAIKKLKEMLNNEN